MKLFVLFPLLLAGALSAHCQLSTANSTLPPPDSLHAALDRHHDRLLAATLAEFDDASGNTWMNWTPSVGVGYAPNGEPRPTASFSLSQVFANLERRKEKKAKRRSIEEAAKLELAQLHSQLDAMLDRYGLMSLELETMSEMFEIDRQLHELETAAYESAEISPMQYLPKQKAFIQSKLAVTRKEIELRELEGEILTFSSLY